MISMSTHLLLSMSTPFLHLKSDLQLKSNKRDDDDHHDDDLVATLPVRLPLGEGVGGYIYIYIYICARVAPV